MLKMKDTQLIVETWRKFINEDTSLMVGPRICQVLMSKEGAKKFCDKTSAPLSSMKPFKQMNKVFHVAKPILNTLIVGPLSMEWNKGNAHHKHQIIGDCYIMIFFYDQQGTNNNEHDYPQRLCNYFFNVGNKGPVDGDEYNKAHDHINSQMAGMIRVEDGEPGMSYHTLYDFCKRCVEGNSEQTEDMIILNPFQRPISGAIAYHNEDKNFSNATVFQA